MFLDFQLDSSKGSLVIVRKKTLQTDRQTDTHTDTQTGEKHICLQPVRQRHNKIHLFKLLKIIHTNFTITPSSI